MITKTFTDKQKKYFTELVGTTFDIVSYLEEDEILKILNNARNLITKYIFIKHDKTDDLYNVKEDYLKKEHFHIIVETIGRKRASSLCNLFNTSEVRRIDTIEQYCGSILYLTHESKKAIAQGKVKYERSKRLSNDFEYFAKILESPQNTHNVALEIINSILLGLPHRELVAMYGRDFVYHYNQYMDMAKLIFNQENKFINREDKANE